MTVECPKCQHENLDETVFCGKCGMKFDSDVGPTLEKPTEILKRGSVFAGRYEIIEELGKGGMGKVYRVEDTKVKEEIALKLIKPEIAADKKIIKSLLPGCAINMKKRIIKRPSGKQAA